jgi:CTP:molybdopterin cytidylyltransferase MocA
MRDVLKLLFDCILNSDFCVPVYKGRGGHPVLLSENVIRDLFAEDKTDITLRDFLSRYDGKRVDVKSDSVLVNINTPEDYRGYFG